MSDAEWKELLTRTTDALSAPTTKVCASCDTTREELTKKVCALVEQFAGRYCMNNVLLSLFAVVVREQFGDAAMFGMANAVLTKLAGDELPITLSADARKRRYHDN